MAQAAAVSAAWQPVQDLPLSNDQMHIMAQQLEVVLILLLFQGPYGQHKNEAVEDV